MAGCLEKSPASRARAACVAAAVDMRRMLVSGFERLRGVRVSSDLYYFFKVRLWINTYLKLIFY